MKAFLILVALMLFITSCAPKISVLSDEVEALKEFHKERENFYKKAFEDGKNACKKEMLAAIHNEISMLKDVIEYEKMVKGGFIVPPKVAKVVVPTEVTPDGKKIRAPYIEWIILEDAKFESRSIVERLLSQKYYVLITILSDLSDAETLRQHISAEVEKDGKSLVKVYKTTKQSFAVVIETKEHALAEKYANKYKGQIL